MRRGLQRVVIKSILIMLALHSAVWAQDAGASGPVFCPGLGGTLTPTLLDVLISPGFTLR